MEEIDKVKKGGMINLDRVSSIPRVANINSSIPIHRVANIKKPFAIELNDEVLQELEIEGDSKSEEIETNSERFKFLTEKYSFLTNHYPVTTQETEHYQLKEWSLTELEELDDWYKLYYPEQWQNWENSTISILKEKDISKDKQDSFIKNNFSLYSLIGSPSYIPNTQDKEPKLVDSEDVPQNETSLDWKKKAVLIFGALTIGIVLVAVGHKMIKRNRNRR